MKTTQLVKINASEYGLEETKAKEIEQAFKPMLEKMTELESEFNEVIKLELNPEACAKAKEIRLKYVKVRTGTATIHKDIKAFYLAGGRFVDGWKNAQLFASEGKEEKLKAIEEHFERIEKQRIDDLREERVKLLEPYGIDTTLVAVGHMAKDVWNNYFTGVKAAHQIQIDAEKKAEADRIAKEKAEKEEQERIAKENERLHKEAEENEKALEVEREKVRKEAEEKEKEMQDEREKAEAERKELEEKAQKEREASEAKAKKEAEEKAEIEAELQAKKDAEVQVIKEAKEAKKQSALAPDKEKLSELIDKINAIEIPELATDKAVDIVNGVNNLLDKVVDYIASKSKEL